MSTPDTVQTPTATPARRTTYGEVLAERRFRLLFLTNTAAVTAYSLRITTLSVLVFANTGSALLSGVAFGIGFLPQLLGTLLLGSLADRLPPRALIVGGHLLEGLAALLLALAPLPVWLVLTLVGLVAIPTPVFNGASSRLVANWLSGDAYVLGRSLNSMAAAGAQLFGLALGGSAVAVLGPRRTMALGAAIYLLCAVAVRLRLPRLAAEPSASPGAAGEGGGRGLVRGSLSAASELLRARPVCRLLLAQWAPSAFVAGAEGLIVAYSGRERFAAGWYAVLLACLPVGMLLGDLLVGRLLRPSARERLVVPLILLMGLPLLGFAAEPGRWFAAALLLATGCGFAYGLGVQRAFLDALPKEGQGQAFGLLSSGLMTVQGVAPIGLGAAASLVGGAHGTAAAMALAGVGALLTALWTASWWRPRSAAAPAA